MSISGDTTVPERHHERGDRRESTSLRSRCMEAERQRWRRERGTHLARARDTAVLAEQVGAQAPAALGSVCSRP
jgi:hypothetical protein